MGWGGGGVEMNSSSKRSDPQRPKKLSASARRTLRRWGPSESDPACTKSVRLKVCKVGHNTEEAEEEDNEEDDEEEEEEEEEED